MKSRLLLQLALDLSRTLGSEDRLQRMLLAIGDTLGADAAALILLEEDRVLVRASHGLTAAGEAGCWGRFEQPRLSAILDSALPVVFPHDCELIDPFDDMLTASGADQHSVHSCLGIPLSFDDDLLGCITADAERLNAFAD